MPDNVFIKKWHTSIEGWQLDWIRWDGNGVITERWVQLNGDGGSRKKASSGRRDRKH